MICPDNASKDFDDLTCQDCKWYMQCFKMWQDGNIFGKEPIGDNFPKINNNIFEKGHYFKKSNNKSPITQEEIEKFKIELGEIIYFSDWEKKINAS